MKKPKVETVKTKRTFKLDGHESFSIFALGRVQISFPELKVVHLEKNEKIFYDASQHGLWAGSMVVKGNACVRFNDIKTVYVKMPVGKKSGSITY